MARFFFQNSTDELSMSSRLRSAQRTELPVYCLLTPPRMMFDVGHQASTPLLQMG
eukprot:CAMPEP_0182833978 /NCGR_PEP_ID=MMETSP0006_2-20121128/20629_1 /TAXON_ID=97485 /ORGANISM="Prymnesium parvum, Strain Texoma1" /LENGTH=54 /DNA_ID=CAMNT_0024962113 /DNA_START=49 /DNA_END=210 /DNA_ORIENTATION=-